MRWVTEDGLHEGYAVAVLADGREATGSGWWQFDGEGGRPLAVGVRAGCNCSNDRGPLGKEWRGEALHPIDFGDHEATEGFGVQGGGPYAEWETTHARPAAGAAVPADVTDLLHTVRTRLTELAEERPLAALSAVARLEALAEATGRRAAGAAQGGGESWTSIGKALGVTKQAAHQRFARHLGAAPAAPRAPEATE